MAGQDPAGQDAQDAAALYDILEREVIPLFYHRDENRILWKPAQQCGRALDDVFIARDLGHPDGTEVEVAFASNQSVRGETTGAQPD